MLSIDLNCDLGEGFMNDAALMPLISSANIACGLHAGDRYTMQKTAGLALQHQVAIGAHPSYPDRAQFGRTDLLHSGITPKKLTAVVAEQIDALQQVCASLGTRLHHVKPHGALYNRAAWDEEAAAAICEAILQIDPALPVYGLSASMFHWVAQQYQLRFVHEVFADRTYQPDGSLTPRKEPGASIENVSQVIEQVLQMVCKGTVQAVDGNDVPIRAETVCIHGDGAHALPFAKAIRTVLDEKRISVMAPGKPV